MGTLQTAPDLAINGLGANLIPAMARAANPSHDVVLPISPPAVAIKCACREGVRWYPNE